MLVHRRLVAVMWSRVSVLWSPYLGWVTMAKLKAKSAKLNSLSASTLHFGFQLGLSYRHACILTYRHSQAHEYSLTGMHAYMRPNIQAYIHTCMHPYMHIYSQSGIHTCFTHARMHPHVHTTSRPR